MRHARTHDYRSKARRLGRAVAVAVALAMIFAACGDDAAEPEETPPTTVAVETTTTTAAPATTAAMEVKEWRDGIPCPPEGTLIAYSPLTLEFVWFADIITAMEEEAAKCGVDVITDDPENDAQNQVTNIENMLERGVSALAVITVDEVTMAPVAERARDDGIIVVRHVGSLEGYDANVGVPETVFGELIGEVGGEWLLDAKPDGAPYQVAILNADSLGPNLLDRKQGLKDGFDRVMAGAEYEIVADVEAWAEDTALDAVAAILAANPDLDVILTSNDVGALGGLAAIEAAGLTPNVDIAIVGSLLERGLQAVADGRMPGGITVPGSTHGVGLIEALFRLLAGEEGGFNMDIPPIKLGNDPTEAQRRLDAGEY